MSLEQFGVSVDDLGASSKMRPDPVVVRGRVANVDADFLCYQVAADTRDELDGIKPRRDFASKCTGVGNLLSRAAAMVGAERYVAHITPSGSDKGGRNDYAVTKPYQGNRKDQEPPEHLAALRGFVGENLPSIVHLAQEADDGMTQANQAAKDAGTPELSVIMSKDKDLRMAAGLHWDYDEECISGADDDYGYIYLDRSKKVTTVKGYGTKFFWAQMLMGDAADNIAGLPVADGDVLFELGVGKKNQKHRKVGPALAVTLLEGLNNNMECWDTIKHLYRTSPHEWVHWNTTEPVAWYAAMVGDMKTLWMRRYENENVLEWLRDIIVEERTHD